MAIPKNITKEHLLKAIEKIDKEGIPKDGDSQYYDVVYNGKKYPPKLIVSYANLFANGEILDRNTFSGGLNTPCFKLMEENKFMIVEKKQGSIEPKIWFVTQGATFTPEQGMKFLWAPEKGKDGKPRFYWENLLKVKKGDIIFNYSEGLKGVSIALTDGYKAINNETISQWSSEGYKVDLDMVQLDPFISGPELASKKKEFDNYLSSVINKPFNANGAVNQGYMYEFSKEAGRFIRDIYRKLFGKKIIDDFFDNVKINGNNILLEIIEAIQSDLIQQQLQEVDFHFTKAQLKLKELMDYKEPSEGFYKNVLQKYTDSGKTYKQYISIIDTSTEEHKLLIKIAELISYCDRNAADKKIHNDYEDKRTLAMSFVRQTTWVKSLLGFKIGNNNLEALPPSIKNAIIYLSNPLNGLTMLSENHREMVANNLLKIKFNHESFVEQLLNFIKPYQITPNNKNNLTWIISNILYLFPKIKRIWFEKVEGLVVCDNTGWIDGAIDDLANAKNIVLWWDKAPSGGQAIIELLEYELENSDEKCFYIYYTANQIANYRARIIDFTFEEDFKTKEWNKDGTTAWHFDNFNEFKSEKENGKTSFAKILFLCDKIEKLRNPIPVTAFSFFKDYQAPTQNNMQPYNSLNKNAVLSEKLIFEIEKPKEDLKYAGLQFNEHLITRFACSLLTKPFVILTGLSGSGKTKLAQAFAMWMCEDDTQYCIVPVGADWTNREPLLGFPNALESEKYVKPDNGVLDLIIEANKNESKPYFLILDEMNLSHVERYFADFLSVMESKNKIALHSGDNDWNGVPPQIGFPKNLFIIGTVNIDETTYMFSPKVLDRASVIEFRVTADEMKTYLDSNAEINLENLRAEGKNMAESFVRLAVDKHEIENEKDKALITESLNIFFTELKKCGAEFGYRSASEILRFTALANRLDAGWKQDEIIDVAIMQKLLPKVHGSRRKLEPVLKTLGTLCLQVGEKMEDYISKSEIKFADRTKIKYPVSLEKILRMYQGLISNGFTSYAEA